MRTHDQRWTRRVISNEPCQARSTGPARRGWGLLVAKQEPVALITATSYVSDGSVVNADGDRLPRHLQHKLTARLQMEMHLFLRDNTPRQQRGDDQFVGQVDNIPPHLRSERLG